MTMPTNTPTHFEYNVCKKERIGFVFLMKMSGLTGRFCRSGGTGSYGLTTDGAGMGCGCGCLDRLSLT